MNNYQAQAQRLIKSYEDYIKDNHKLAIKQMEDYKIPASITLAQALLESAAGTSTLAVNGNNHFGIKCTKEWTGATIYKDDNLPNECFRKYKNKKESYEDHSLFLKRSPYVSLFTYDIANYISWANGLQSCGYATDKTYGSKLIKLIEDYRLFSYDSICLVSQHIPYKSPVSKPASNRPNVKRQPYLTYGLLYVEAENNDRLSYIAEDMNFDLKKLLKYNDLSDDKQLKKGDVVYLEEKRDKAILPYTVYIVKDGDTMYYIAQQFGVRLKNLCKLNSVSETYRPKTGEVIKLR
ncbi:MAG: glucosaminidase domain-containing protein [Dysgonamonadaceae bacterium]|nr:glucosaminidase domain-containing protein [Dysgonamonadaceae bacterium]